MGSVVFWAQRATDIWEMSFGIFQSERTGVIYGEVFIVQKFAEKILSLALSLFLYRDGLITDKPESGKRKMHGREKERERESDNNRDKIRNTETKKKKNGREREFRKERYLYRKGTGMYK